MSSDVSDQAPEQDSDADRQPEAAVDAPTAVVSEGERGPDGHAAEERPAKTGVPAVDDVIDRVAEATRMSAQEAVEVLDSAREKLEDVLRESSGNSGRANNG